MKDSLAKLTSVAGAPFAIALPSTPLDLNAVGLDHDFGLAELLATRNGFFAFEGALRVFGTQTSPSSHSLAAWNADHLWRDSFGTLASGCFFFAEDVFGHQFALTASGICSFDAETAQLSQMGRSVRAWAEAVLNDFEFLTGQPLAHEWQVVNGPLPPNERLLPVTPFALGGEYSLDNLKAVDGAQAMRIRGPLALQLHRTPDGSAIELSVGE